MRHRAIEAGRVAVVTGGASGIGYAAARRFGLAGMTVVLADLPGEALNAAAAALLVEGIDAVAMPADVSDRSQMSELKDAAERLGPVSVLLSNAGCEGGGSLFADEAVWRATLEVNLWGAIHAAQLFLPAMIAADGPGTIIFTGSKQGITLPPGDTAYNVSKAGLRALAESVSHDLTTQTDGRVSAHLLIPGFTFTGFTRAKGVAEKPAGAWTSDQVVDQLMDGLERGDFYVLCQDNETDRKTDLKRIRWGLGDILENRPPLSRWHPDYAEHFARYMVDDA